MTVSDTDLEVLAGLDFEARVPCEGPFYIAPPMPCPQDAAAEWSAWLQCPACAFTREHSHLMCTACVEEWALMVVGVASVYPAAKCKRCGSLFFAAPVAKILKRSPL